MFLGEECCLKKIKVDKLSLHSATMENDLAEMERLLKNGHGAYVNEQDNCMCTPLHYVCSKDAARLLIANGADVNAKNEQGYTPLSTAFCYDDTDVASILLKNGANFTETKQILCLPLDLTIKEFFNIMCFGDRKPPC